MSTCRNAALWASCEARSFYRRCNCFWLLFSLLIYNLNSPDLEKLDFRFFFKLYSKLMFSGYVYRLSCLNLCRSRIKTVVKKNQAVFLVKTQSLLIIF